MLWRQHELRQHEPRDVAADLRRVARLWNHVPSILHLHRASAFASYAGSGFSCGTAVLTTERSSQFASKHHYCGPSLMDFWKTCAKGDRTSSRVTSRHLKLSNILPRGLSDACLLTTSSEPPVLPAGRHPTTLSDSWRCRVGKQMFPDASGQLAGNSACYRIKPVRETLSDTATGPKTSPEMFSDNEMAADVTTVGSTPRRVACFLVCN